MSALSFRLNSANFQTQTDAKMRNNSKGKTNENFPDFPLFFFFSMIFPSWIFFCDSALFVHNDGNIDDTSGM